jgi:hypothetical protein
MLFHSEMAPAGAFHASVAVERGRFLFSHCTLEKILLGGYYTVCFQQLTLIETN